MRGQNIAKLLIDILLSKSSIIPNLKVHVMQTQSPPVCVWIDPHSKDIIAELDRKRIFVTQAPAKATVFLFPDEKNFYDQIGRLILTNHHTIVIFTQEEEVELEYNGTSVYKMKQENFYSWCKPAVRPVESNHKPSQGLWGRLFGTKNVA